MRCAKTAEPIVMQFGMLSRVGLGRKHVLHGDVDAPARTGTFGSLYNAFEKHCKA